MILNREKKGGAVSALRHQVVLKLSKYHSCFLFLWIDKVSKAEIILNPKVYLCHANVQKDTYMQNLQLQKDVEPAHQKPLPYTFASFDGHTNGVIFGKDSQLSIYFLCMSGNTISKFSFIYKSVSPIESKQSTSPALEKVKDIRDS